MKKILLKHTIKACIVLGAIMLTASSCQKKLKDLYLDPDGFTTPTIEGFYTNAQQSLGLFRYSYGEMYHTFNAFNPMLGSGGYENSGIPSNFSWLYDPYGDAYSKLRNIRGMQDFYNTLSNDVDKQNYGIFLWTATVIQDYIFYNLTDALGDVPYSDAMKAKDNNFFPKFDKQEAIYDSIFLHLKTVSDKLKGYTLNGSVIHKTFAKNDVWFKGDVNKWRIFVNSLRLRLAMRLTNVKPEKAKAIFQEVLADGVYTKDRATTITHIDGQPDRASEYLIFRSFSERISMLWAPENLMKVLRKAGFPDDPRIKVLFQPDKNGNYTPMPTEGADVTAIAGQISNDLTNSFPSRYNRLTFETNVGMPYQIITSSEVHLLKVEAGLRWPDLGIVVANEYKAAIQESIDIYYEINALNTNTGFNGYFAAQRATKPTQPEIDLFLAAKVTEFTAASATEKMGLMYDQKYAHFNMLKPYELWADTRRLTKELGARVKKGPSNVKMMERTVYPTSEELNNGANFLAVKAANNYTTPVWWTGR